MRLTRLAIVFASFFGLSCSMTKPYTISNSAPLEAQILDLLNHPETKYFYSTDKIPKRLLAKAKAVSKHEMLEFDGVYTMANPNEPFRHGCVREKDQIFTRRLIFVARLKNQHVLCYERGGRAHNLLISYAQTNGRHMSYYNISLHGIEPCTEYTNLEQIKLALKESHISINYQNGEATKRRFVPF
jgi:hypothetical protein